jgi:purine-binding chemotaxis protein CheW
MPNDTYVLFELAGADYALRSSEVQHIEMLEHITPVPNTAPSVEGVVFSRGQVIPAMNLRVRFGFPAQPHSMRTRLVVAQTDKRTVALIVDAAREFRSIPDDTIRAIDETVSGISGNYLRGVATVNNRMVLLLDLEAVLTLAGKGNPAEVIAQLQGMPVPPEKLLKQSQPAHA